VVEVRWLNDEEQAVWRDLLAFQNALTSRLDRELHAAVGLGLNDYEVLVHLSEAPDGSLRMADLAARCARSPSGLTRRVDRLARAGLVSRQPCLEDGRGWFAVITPEGRERLEQAAPVHVAGVRRYLFDPLGAATSSSVKGLAEGLAAVGGAMKKEHDDAAWGPTKRGAHRGSAPIAG
jgi:DNA-binding MarR family transcriptional regulator